MGTFAFRQDESSDHGVLSPSSEGEATHHVAGYSSMKDIQRKMGHSFHKEDPFSGDTMHVRKASTKTAKKAMREGSSEYSAPGEGKYGGYRLKK